MRKYYLRGKWFTHQEVRFEFSKVKRGEKRKREKRKRKKESREDQFQSLVIKGGNVVEYPLPDLFFVVSISVDDVVLVIKK
jgi:hypothetical protein